MKPSQKSLKGWIWRTSRLVDSEVLGGRHPWKALGSCMPLLGIGSVSFFHLVVVVFFYNKWVIASKALSLSYSNK